MGLAGAIYRKTGGNPRAIRRTHDFRRIEEIPRRTSYPDYRHALTAWLKTDAGTMSLRPEQAWALTEMVAKGGLLGALGIGVGKTLLTALAPVVMDAKRPLLLVPASLREKTLNISFPMLRQHWRLHPNLRVMSYESLSQVKQADILGRIMPDLVICDEVQKCKNKSAGVTRRLLRYYDDYPETRFVGVSASISRRSIKDFAHLIYLALRDDSPVPTSYMDLEDWALLVDEGVSDEMRPDPSLFLETFCLPNETPRQGFRRRLLETEGYVATATPSVLKADGAEVSLLIKERTVEVPQVVKDAFAKLRGAWVTPDGGEFTGSVDFAGHARELACGFFYRWVWPNNVIDGEWMEARKKWKSFVRRTIRYSGHRSERFFRADNFKQDGDVSVAVLKSGGKFKIGEIITVDAFNTSKLYEIIDVKKIKNEGPYGIYELRMVEPTHSVYYDTELQVSQACAAGRLKCRENEYAAWKAIEDRCDPPTEAVWISDFLVDAAVAWASENIGIIWTDQKALLAKLRERGLPCFGGGQNDIQYEKGDRSVVASIDAHREGKDLQMFHQCLYLCVPKSGEIWEQSLGREHRSGQEEDVEAEVFLHAMELWKSFEQARKDAKYLLDNMGQEQRLLYADIVVSSEKQVIARAEKSKMDPLWLVEWPATQLDDLDDEEDEKEDKKVGTAA